MTRIAQIPHGLHLGVHHGVYHEPVLGMASASALTRILRSPRHYRAWLAGETEEGDSPAPTFGRAFHCATLEPQCFAQTYAVAPDFGSCRANRADGTTKEEGAANKARRDAWRAEHEGFEELSAADWARALGMSESIANHPYAGPLLRGGQAEVTLRWRDEETGLECRARADYYREDLATVIDLKTCMDARPWAFRNDSRRYGYARQEAFYRAGFAALGKPVRNFVFCACEKPAPHDLKILWHSAMSVADGHEQVRAAMHTLARCLREDSWPGYDADMTEVDTTTSRAA